MYRAPISLTRARTSFSIKRHPSILVDLSRLSRSSLLLGARSPARSHVTSYAFSTEEKPPSRYPPVLLSLAPLYPYTPHSEHPRCSCCCRSPPTRLAPHHFDLSLSSPSSILPPPLAIIGDESTARAHVHDRHRWACAWVQTREQARAATNARGMSPQRPCACARPWFYPLSNPLPPNEGNGAATGIMQTLPLLSRDYRMILLRDNFRLEICLGRRDSLIVSLFLSFQF